MMSGGYHGTNPGSVIEGAGSPQPSGVPLAPEALVAAHPNAIWTHADAMVEPLDMAPTMVTLADVAYALSNCTRFTGHMKRGGPGIPGASEVGDFPFSVAQHSCNVARLVMRRAIDGATWDDVMYGLLHDATEAYLSDMARPLKHYNEFGDAYRTIEDGLMVAIAEHFDLAPGPMPKVVKWADDMALRAECRDFMGPTMRAMYYEPQADDVDMYFPEPLEVWTHRRAEREFLALFHMLDALRHGHLPVAPIDVTEEV